MAGLGGAGTGGSAGAGTGGGIDPRCSAGVCETLCGDGVVVVGEACDDGNTVGGDGCSGGCTIEPGYECPPGVPGDKMLVPIVYRDFRASHLDFEPGATGLMTALTGMVQPDLDANGKPVFTGIASAYTTAATFAEWYRDTPGVNHTTVGRLPLFGDGGGNYSNRFGPNGERWPLTTMLFFCGVVGSERIDTATGLPIPCTYMFASTDCDAAMALGYTMISCGLSSTTYTAVFQTGALDGTPLFFPVDGDTFTPASERSSATLPPPYAASTFPTEPGAPLHNFSFTSEAHFWFRFDANRQSTIDFTGDDDVWVFVNRKLAVDVGGIHTPVKKSVTLSSENAATYGLTDGSVYEAVVFHAERQRTSSTYALTLTGFTATGSQCRPIVATESSGRRNPTR
jgi:fibro-slime domain-containing protein